ncbi:helix-turn-helix domain-containing protein [Pseudoalteromonas aurantia]|uniref:Transcriptional regulator n=1 Tax=Pseudoalteromonas aurantia TaxID=43654 RepID=A0A5S3V6V6_9GAMM|nr:helix-turn-helix transcriptional regulator [Pseudoalteromonas aurantia]TMO57793.1 transcriptional regulator [Pseudoalteromonas aurantia]TMO67414.1 transcriptional regulator [Pseudoalteromonas aurantia]TMO70553.1 transcriptional regulator [Pseudoalteromonas aurantia]
MTLGQYIKQLRTTANMSQPQLAEKMDVEQSYLSKLENDKSVPSNEVFRQLLDALELTVDNFMLGAQGQANKHHFSQIPDIESWYARQCRDNSIKQRTLLYIAILLVSLGGSCFYVGFQNLVFPQSLYEYESRGVVLPNEPQDIFSSWSRFVPDDADKREAQRIMLKRRDISIVLSFEYLGDEFIKEVEQGRRLYRVGKDVKQQTRFGNTLLQFLGLACVLLGVALMIIEPRLTRSKV